MIRSKGEPGTGNVVEAVRHCRQVMDDPCAHGSLPEAEVANFAKENGAPGSLHGRAQGRPPACGELAAGGIATPLTPGDDALGCDGVFVGSGIFKSGDPAMCARHRAGRDQLQVTTPWPRSPATWANPWWHRHLHHPAAERMQVSGAGSMARHRSPGPAGGLPRTCRSAAPSGRLMSAKCASSRTWKALRHGHPSAVGKHHHRQAAGGMGHAGAAAPRILDGNAPFTAAARA